MQCKGEVALTTAEVNDVQRSLGGEVLQDVVDEFEVAVDLAKLVVHRRPDLAVGQHNADLDQERARLANGDQVFLLAVVACDGLRRE